MITADNKVKIKENEKINKYLDLVVTEPKKSAEYEYEDNINCYWCIWNDL